MSLQERPRLAILISGRGSNLQAFIDACARDELAAHICVVISNNPAAAGLQRAAQAGLETRCIDHRDYRTRETFDAALVQELRAYAADVVVLAGFMRILTPVLIEPYIGRLVNIHPSLLPKYTGLRTHQRALNAGDSEAGATVHFVTQELDGGPPVLQARVPILPEDNPDTLAARVATVEHIIYPMAVRWLLEGRLALTDKGATLDGKPIPACGIRFADDLN